MRLPKPGHADRCTAEHTEKIPPPHARTLRVRMRHCKRDRSPLVEAHRLHNRPVNHGLASVSGQMRIKCGYDGFDTSSPIYHGIPANL